MQCLGVLWLLCRCSEYEELLAPYPIDLAASLVLRWPGVMVGLNCQSLTESRIIKGENLSEGLSTLG